LTAERPSFQSASGDDCFVVLSAPPGIETIKVQRAATCATVGVAADIEEKVSDADDANLSSRFEDRDLFVVCVNELTVSVVLIAIVTFKRLVLATHKGQL
jgi:hypothetical protein